MILQGLQLALEPASLVLTVIGTIVGIVFGCIPGLNATIAVTMFLPMTFTMPPAHGIALLMGLYTGGISGGLISAILLNIPGTTASVATLFDGHPMAQKGQAGKALGAAILASFVGGAISIIALIFISPWLADLTLKFWPAEYFSICVFSLTIIASLSGKNMIKGVCAGIIGLALSLIGTGPIDGTLRFTFGSKMLYSGLTQVSFFIGLYAITEIIKNAFKRRTLLEKAEQNKIEKGFSFFGISRTEFVHNIGNMLRSSAIGTVIGILPGVGANVGGMMAYDVEKKLNKEKDKFGTGVVDGVIASEAANNAVIGGSLIPLITLGIPGNTVSAVLLGALTVHQINPGPLIFTNNGAVMYSLFFALVVADIAMLLFERGGLKAFIKVLALPKNFLMPVIVVLCFVGCYSTNFRIFDIQLAIIAGIAGIFLNLLQVPVLPMTIGFILGETFEYNLRKALMQSQGSWSAFVTRPISCAFLIIAAASIALILFSHLKERKSTTAVNEKAEVTFEED